MVPAGLAVAACVGEQRPMPVAMRMTRSVAAGTGAAAARAVGHSSSRRRPGRGGGWRAAAPATLASTQTMTHMCCTRSSIALHRCVDRVRVGKGWLVAAAWGCRWRVGGVCGGRIGQPLVTEMGCACRLWRKCLVAGEVEWRYLGFMALAWHLRWLSGAVSVVLFA